VAVLCLLVTRLVSYAGIYNASTEVTYKEYWVGRSQFDGGCGTYYSYPPAWYLEPWGSTPTCVKTINLTIPDDFSQALKAEVYIDYWRNHTARVSKFTLNGHSYAPSVGDEWSRTPYVAEIPLGHLVQGTNTFEFWADPYRGHHIHDIAIRIYHDESHPLIAGPGSQVTPPNGLLTSIVVDGVSYDPSAGAILNVDNNLITFNATASGKVKFVEFHGFYDGYDEDNDGVTRDWHNLGRNNWHPGGIEASSHPEGGTINHIGTAVTSPYSVTWSLPHIVNQTGVRFKVRVVDSTGNVREAAGGVSAEFALKRSYSVSSYTIPGFRDSVLNHGGTLPTTYTTYITLPGNISNVTHAYMLGNYWQNPFIKLNNHTNFTAFNWSEDVWTLSVRSLAVSQLVPGQNQIEYLHNPSQISFGQFIEKPGPMIVLRGPDTQKPEISSQSPAPGSTNIHPATAINLRLRDQGTGINLSSISMRVNGELVAHAITGDYHDALIAYTPPAKFGYGDTVTVRVEACDQTSSPNCLDTLYSFVVAGPPFVSDDFNSRNLNTGLWTFVNPLDDAALLMTGYNTADAHLKLVLPAGTSHDVWVGGNKAARVMQQSTNVDFVAEVKFESILNAAYQIQGIIVEESSSRFLRFDFVRNDFNTRIFAASFTNAQPSVRHDSPILTTSPLYLRVERAGNTWTQSYSYDGSNWTVAMSFNESMTASAIGPFAGNAGANPPAFTCVVDYFMNNESPIVPEDGYPAPTDTLPPFITAVRVTAGETEATVEWTTDEFATSTVACGHTTAYEHGETSTPGFTQSHAVLLTGLTPSTTYHIQVSSEDPDGRTSYSPDYTFITAGPPPPPPPSTLVSDHFSSAELNTSLWTAVDPVGGASFSVTGSQLLISLPGGTSRDVWIGGNNAARVMQETNNTDFEVETKIDSPLTTQYQIQGILVEKNSQDFVRFDFVRDASGTRVFAATFTGGSPSIRVDTYISTTYPLYLRVRREGNQWTQYYSTDGTSWSTATSFSHALTVTSVGLFAGIAGSPAPAFSALFDYFATTTTAANIRVVLEGPCSVAGDSMRTDIHGLLPLDQPYTTAPHNYAGTESVTQIPDGAVDWILVELRTGTESTSKIAERAGFLRHDGMIVDLDGLSPLRFPTVEPGDYYVVVRHRNHLDIMSAAPIALSHLSTLYDFTTSQSQAYGSAPMKAKGSAFVMTAGDIDGNQGIGASDLVAARLAVGSLEYRVEDVDMNGGVGASDLVTVRTNVGAISQVP
jgi:regulation of enolase protein 1 (concanavalin A-like superfamily)